MGNQFNGFIKSHEFKARVDFVADKEEEETVCDNMYLPCLNAFRAIWLKGRRAQVDIKRRERCGSQ